MSLVNEGYIECMSDPFWKQFVHYRDKLVSTLVQIMEKEEEPIVWGQTSIGLEPFLNNQKHSELKFLLEK